MKNLALTLAVIAAMALASGCSNKKKETPKNTLTDIPPAASVSGNPMPVTAVQPVTPIQPVSTYTPDTTASDPSLTAGGKRTYTVKKGDTLWGIAKSNYGDGKQYTKILAANPGVSPQQLKVGQTLVIP